MSAHSTLATPFRPVWEASHELCDADGDWTGERVMLWRGHYYTSEVWYFGGRPKTNESLETIGWSARVLANGRRPR